jgi:hypothetical protein
MFPGKAAILFLYAGAALAVLYPQYSLLLLIVGLLFIYFFKKHLRK